MGTIAAVIMTNPKKISHEELENKYRLTNDNYQMWAKKEGVNLRIGSHFKKEEEFKEFLEMLYVKYDMDILKVLWWDYKKEN